MRYTLFSALAAAPILIGTATPLRAEETHVMPTPAAATPSNERRATNAKTDAKPKSKIQNSKSAPAKAVPTPGALPLGVLLSPTPNGKFLFNGSARVRDENYNWWPTDQRAPGANGAYNFVGINLRGGVSRSTKRDDFVLDLQVPVLAGLPTRAIAAAPQGILGQGGNYYDANHSQVASFYPRQLYFRLKNIDGEGASLRLGRYEFSDGSEVMPTDPTLTFLKASRLTQRLLGPFNFTHIGRSFDGFNVVKSLPKANFTGVAAFPTRGAFSLNGGDTLTDIGVLYGALTFPVASKKNAGEGRAFALFYSDDRGAQVNKVDNRPLAVRNADKNVINLYTLGGHYMHTVELGSGRVDGLFWGRVTVRQMGTRKIRARSRFAAELGYQPHFLKGRPWFRVGYNYYSGDGNATNGTHGTFIPILPTPRIYARYPFFTEANLKDAFVQAIYRPTSKLTLRFDAHQLQLADTHDLWYVGGGAYENKNFGYAGRPSNGHGDLAGLFDLSADYALRKNTQVSLYFAYANGGHVVRSIYGSLDSLYGYAEIQHRF